LLGKFAGSHGPYRRGVRRSPRSVVRLGAAGHRSSWACRRTSGPARFDKLTTSVIAQARRTPPH